MDTYKKTIFWVTTSDGDEDWFVVSPDRYLAEKFFSKREGYPIEYVGAEEICLADFEEEVNAQDESYFPSHLMLQQNGFEIISKDEPRIFWRQGKKYCQGNIIKSILVGRGDKKSGVYIIAVRDTDLYKIGITKDIKSRLNQLQTSNPYEFYLIEFFLTDKSRELEKLLHKMYSLKRYKREWFKLDGDDVHDACQFASEFVGRPYIKVTQADIEKFEKQIALLAGQLKADDDLPF